MQRELSLYYEQNKKSGFYPRMLQAKHNSLVTRSVDRSYLDNMLSKPLIYYQFIHTQLYSKDNQAVL